MDNNPQSLGLVRYHIVQTSTTMLDFRYVEPGSDLAKKICWVSMSGEVVAQAAAAEMEKEYLITQAQPEGYLRVLPVVDTKIVDIRYSEDAAKRALERLKEKDPLAKFQISVVPDDDSETMQIQLVTQNMKQKTDAFSLCGCSISWEQVQTLASQAKAIFGDKPFRSSVLAAYIDGEGKAIFPGLVIDTPSRREQFCRRILQAMKTKGWAEPAARLWVIHL